MLQKKENEKPESFEINNNMNNKEEKKDNDNNDNNTNKISISSSEENNLNINEEIINNLLNNPNNKSKELQFKINQPFDSNSIENVKQDIINFYLIEKQKCEEKKREIVTNKNYNTHNKSKISRPYSTKNTCKKNHFEKYDKEKISYEIYHQYQKLNFNCTSIPFIQRMELYSLKRCLKDYKVEELTNLQSPKISEKEIVKTFNRLIEDSNRRLINTKKIIKQKERNETDINNKNNNNNKDNKNKDNNKNKIIINKKSNNKVIKNNYNKKAWDEIYEKRFGSKLKERNDKIEKKRKEKEAQIKKEEDSIIDNLNKKQEILNQRYNMKRNNSANNLTKSSIHSLNTNKYYIGNSKLVTNLNQRLYYNEINKKDIYYKSFLEKANELIDNCEINEKNKIKRKEKGNKINSFRNGINIKNKKNIKNKEIYNFADFDDGNNIKEEEKNNHFNNIIKDIKDDIDLRISETSIVNNSKNELTGTLSNNKGRNESAEKIIDRFFEN